MHFGFESLITNYADFSVIRVKGKRQREDGPIAPKEKREPGERMRQNSSIQQILIAKFAHIMEIIAMRAYERGTRNFNVFRRGTVANRSHHFLSVLPYSCTEN